VKRVFKGRIVTVLKPILIEGYTSEEILGLPPNQLKNFVFIGKPLVFKTGSAQILGEFTLRDNRLVIERVLAAAGLEKGKKCPLSLASQRRAA
jgi:hypothetical protein